MFSNISRGFTLIEAMITLAIIGILAAVAYPAYTGYVEQARRTECEAALLQLASAMERDFSRSTNHQYRDIINTVPPRFPNTCPIDGAGAPTYDLSIPAATLTVSTYTLVATPVAAAAQANSPCGRLTLTNLLQKGQDSGTLDQCW